MNWRITVAAAAMLLSSGCIVETEDDVDLPDEEDGAEIQGGLGFGPDDCGLELWMPVQELFDDFGVLSRLDRGNVGEIRDVYAPKRRPEAPRGASRVGACMHGGLCGNGR